MAPTILVLQHIACEPPGVYGDVLVERGAVLERVDVDMGAPLPDWRRYDAIIAMGGPMGANDDAGYPWLTAEKALIREAVDAGTPYVGVCLGAQLLAASLGAEVVTGRREEVGVLEVALTDAGAADPVLGALPATVRTLQWHADTFALPTGAVLLASSTAYPHQAFRVRRAYALQFHLEVTLAMARAWADVPAYARSLTAVHGPGALSRLLDAVAREEAAMAAHARALATRWAALVEAYAARGPTVVAHP